MELVLTVIAVTVLGVVLLAAVAVERWLRGPGLDRARAQLAELLSVDPDRMALEVDAPRLLPAVLGRRDARVRLHARDVPLASGEAMLRDLTVDLHGVRGHGGWRPDALLIDGGRFVAHLEERELPALLPLRGAVTRVEVRADGIRLWTVAAVPLDAAVVVDEEDLLIQADPAQLTKLLEMPGLGMMRRLVSQAQLSVPLPTLPLDASIRELGFDHGMVQVRGRVPPQLLRQDGSHVRASTTPRLT